MGGVGDGDLVVLEESSAEKDFMKRFLKHAKAKSSEPPKNDGHKKKVDISIVRKEVDDDGKERLKTDVINYR